MTATGKAPARNGPAECRALPQSTPISPAICRTYLEKVCTSFSFGRAGQLRRLLRWLGERALATGPVIPAEREIGVEVLGRGDFDPQTDSIVRKEMGRLRERLARYYTAEGAGDEVVVRLEAGYLPQFRRREGARAEGERPCWLVLPFRTGDDLVEESELLLEELLMELGAGDLELVSPTTALGYRGRSGDIREFAAECRADYVVEGRLRRGVAAMEGMAWVIDGQSGRAQRYRRTAGADSAEIAREIAAWVLAKSHEPGLGPG